MDIHERLFALERKLKTGNYEAQVVSLQEIPSLMDGLQDINQEQASLIHSTIYLRLTDYFCACTGNELRRACLNAVRQCSLKNFKYGSGVYTDEIIKRLGNIWRSNDIIARCMVIRFYGYLAHWVVSSPEALYRISASIKSDNDDEYETAIDIIHSMFERLPRSSKPTVIMAVLETFSKKDLHPGSSTLQRIINILEIGSDDVTCDQLVLNILLSVPWSPSHVIDSYKDRLNVTY